MRSFGLGADGLCTSARVSTMHPALLLAVGLALLTGGAHPASAQSQDTIRVAGTVLAPDEAAQARRLLRAELGPTSRHWTRLQDSTKRFAAAKTAFQIGRVAYPRAWSDSVLTFLREAGTRHPDPAVRAEFLFGGLQVASAAERGGTQDQFYRRLTDGHEGTHYATKARRLFDPDSQIQAGKPLPDFEIPALSDPTATYTKRDFEGQTVLIDIWGTWCGPCIRAMPHLHEAYRTHGGEDFTILSVAMRDTREAVKQFRAHKWEMPWDHAFVPKGSDLQKKLRGRFDIRGLPATILVGPDGQILRVHRGVGSGKKMARAISEVLAQDLDSENAPSEGAHSEDASGQESNASL
ncbi:TlpA family protein disulfide reductase [Salinibacter ruber]|uniref:Thiol-disulfide isomerase/thioredoxin n=2 Tax=Salinibacter ruber TaxID=146919 RepID=A0A9X2U543_9BACT|nr:TlpA disulfide reductase family protein [Salinibacter ruber]MCS3656404.1 thiol-disulfide isomerase/thioredoxin [Salinibacter ruber]MCS3950083.1 thiol-disulfide isomerase/thioredoxin [Salinibacter ruber]MCS4116845.1 thiol-disulfide isomerase/thioredoxin [Salinibacter ruber]MCS4153685.1 thiol-disulfide isomerase/thioredoxin [Salinibacter ruber]MCS4169822.1 thiol-disulfide isomerase/thioredoxin [Salinibacter ruber]